MKFAIVGGAVGMFAIMGQQASQYLDAQFDGIDPNLLAALGSVEKQMTQGLTATQIALASIAIPIAYQLIKVGQGFSTSRHETVAAKRERETLEHAAKVERETKRFEAQIEIDKAAALERIKGGFGEPPAMLEVKRLPQ